MNELALFAGSGGGILGGKLLGWRTLCAVEWEPYARDVLVSRQNDGSLEPFPIWDDVQTFDGHPWRGRIDVVSGGFPCQDISTAGKGAGIDGARSGMWTHMARIVGEVRPRFVFVENSPQLVGRGLARVLGDLASLGYHARWDIMGAHHLGAPHKRDRIWIVAYRDGADVEDLLDEPGGLDEGTGTLDEAERGTVLPVDRSSREVEHVGDTHGIEGGTGLRETAPKLDGIESGDPGGAPADPGCPLLEVGTEGQRNRRRGDAECGPGETEVAAPNGMPGEQHGNPPGVGWWWQHDPADGPGPGESATEPVLGRVVDGVACRVDRLRCIGNGQVPHVAAVAFQLLAQDLL